MIFTECPHCDDPKQVPLNRDHIGQYANYTCDKCEENFVVQHVRVDGTTYTEDYFEREVLPEIA